MCEIRHVALMGSTAVAFSLGSISSRFGSPVVIPWCGARNPGSQKGWKSSLHFLLHRLKIPRVVFHLSWLLELLRCLLHLEKTCWTIHQLPNEHGPIKWWIKQNLWECKHLKTWVNGYQSHGVLPYFVTCPYNHKIKSGSWTRDEATISGGGIAKRYRIWTNGHCFMNKSK